MRLDWKVLFNSLIDTVATLGFFYAGFIIIAYAAGVTAASLVYAASLISGPAHFLAAGSFLYTVLLITLTALTPALAFAIAIEILRRLIGREPPLLYVAGMAAAMLVFMRPDGTDAPAVAILVVSGAIAGLVYWLVTIRLRAALSWLLRRLLCGAEPRTASCAFL